MSLLQCLKLSDTDTIPVLQVGSIVVPKDPQAGKLAYPKVPGISGTYYKTAPSAGFAVVVSLAPFTLASADATMRWQTTVAETDFVAIGTAMPDVLTTAMTRALA